MPYINTWAQFLDAVATGKTNTTNVLDGLFTKPNALRDNPLFGWFNTPRALDQPLPQNVRAFLRGRGLIDVELQEIDDWPINPKEDVRSTLVGAIQDPANRPVHFFWRLSAGPVEDARSRDPDEQGDITIEFLSPVSKVTGVPASQRVSVKVGP